jgi:hypothetical protein
VLSNPGVNVKTNRQSWSWLELDQRLPKKATQRLAVPERAERVVLLSGIPFDSVQDVHHRTHIGSD